MPLDEVLAKLKSSRFNVGTCTDIKDVNRMLVNYQNSVQQFAEEVAGNPSTLIIFGLATGVVADTDATFSIDNIVSLSSGYTHSASSQVVSNTFAKSLNNNDPVLAIYDFINDIWLAWYDTDTGDGEGGDSYYAGFGLELTTNTFSVDDTGYTGAGIELFGSNDGVVGWFDASGLGGGTYAAGFGLELSAGEFSVDDTGYDGGEGVYELFGATEGTVQWDTVSGWLETLPDFDDDVSSHQVLSNEGGIIKWIEDAGGGSGDVKIVLIDADIPGIEEANPGDYWEEADIDLGEDDDWEVKFQDPPDDDLTANWVSGLNRWRYDRVQVDLKYYQSDDEDSSLAYSVIDDEANERKIVRYATTSVWYDDGKPFLVGKYTRADYPDFDESTEFPSDEEGGDLPLGFLNRRYRGIAINGVLITASCKVLPAPELPD